MADVVACQRLELVYRLQDHGRCNAKEWTVPQSRDDVHVPVVRQTRPHRLQWSYRA